MREAFILRSQKKFGGTLADFEKGGRSEHMPCNHLQKVDDFHEFLEKDILCVIIGSYVQGGEGNAIYSVR